MSKNSSSITNTVRDIYMYMCMHMSVHAGVCACATIYVIKLGSENNINYFFKKLK